MKKTKDQSFWEFSLKLYSQSEVEQNLLFLQNHYGCNVNIVLFCCWYGLEGQGRLSQKRLSSIIDSIQYWHERIVKPLRQLRKTMKRYRLIKDDPLNGESVLAEEINAEKIEQRMIVDKVSIERHGSKSPIFKVIDVCKSLLNYLRIRGVLLGDDGVDSVVTILSQVFPSVPLDEVANIVSEHFFEDAGLSGCIGTQLWLEL